MVANLAMIPPLLGSTMTTMELVQTHTIYVDLTGKEYIFEFCGLLDIPTWLKKERKRKHRISDQPDIDIQIKKTQVLHSTVIASKVTMQHD